MTLDEFQQKSKALAAKGPGGVEAFQWCSRGLIESAGKIDRLLRNSSFQGQSLLEGENARRILDELGFVLWYGAVLADALDQSLETTANEHLRKMGAILNDPKNP